MKVIDMRCRPAFLHDFFGATPGSLANDAARWLNRRVGTRGDDEHYARSRTQEGFLAEVREAGLAKAVRQRIEALLPSRLGALASALHAARGTMKAPSLQWPGL